MTDPNNPAGPPVTPPGAPVPPPGAPVPPTAPPAYPGQQAPGQAYGAYPNNPGYAAAPPPSNMTPPEDAPVPGRTLGIVAFVLSFFAAVIALVLGIVALVQSRKVGRSNGWALAAIIISSVAIVLGIIFTIIFFALIVPGLAQVGNEMQDIVEQCSMYGGGIVEINGAQIDCDEVLGLLDE